MRAMSATARSHAHQARNDAGVPGSSGVTRNVLIDVEYGRRGLLYERLFDIAEALNVPVGDLLAAEATQTRAKKRRSKRR